MLTAEPLLLRPSENIVIKFDIYKLCDMAGKRTADMLSEENNACSENGSKLTEGPGPCKKQAADGGVCSGTSPLEDLKARACTFGCELTSEEFANRMDAEDPLRHLRGEFHYPKMKEMPKVDLSLVNPEDESVYFCGNSLGLQPKGVKQYFDAELEKWAKTGVHGHFNGQLPWAFCDEVLISDMATIVGAEDNEVAVMNGLTVNLHLLLISFYQPTAKRHKILIESKAFPSDHYTVESQIRLHGYDPATSLICIEPRQGENSIRTEDVLARIEEEGDSIAVVLLGGLQYYIGQLFNMPEITKAGHAKGCYVGFDLAHAVGNVEISLHEWEVDFAVWCSYKYLNSGAGSLAGAFLHSKHANTIKPKLIGWWGHKFKSRFQMTNELDLSPGIEGFRLTNPSIFAACPLRASLDVFKKTSMSALRAKSVLLTGYLYHLIGLYFESTSLQRKSKAYITILTPPDPAQRGVQLSLFFSISITNIHKELTKRGIVCDEREPNVIRIAPAPMYCSFNDVWRFIESLKEIMPLVDDLSGPNGGPNSVDGELD